MSATARPKTAPLMWPSNTSGGSSHCWVRVMNGPADTPCTDTETMWAPKMPAVSKSSVSTGTMKRPARTRGTSRNCTGLTAMVSRASTCSVTRMVPSSVHMAEPARMVIINAENTGASSRVSTSATVGPTRLWASNMAKARADWLANTMPVNKPVSRTMKTLPTPTKSNWKKRLVRRRGRRTLRRATSAPSVIRRPRSSTRSMRPRPRDSMACTSAEGRGGSCAFWGVSGGTGASYSTCPRSGHKQSLQAPPPGLSGTPGIQARAPPPTKGFLRSEVAVMFRPPFSTPLTEKREAHTHGDPTQGRRRGRRVLYPVPTHARTHHPRDGGHEDRPRPLQHLQRRPRLPLRAGHHRQADALGPLQRFLLLQRLASQGEPFLRGEGHHLLRGATGGQGHRQRPALQPQGHL